MSKSSKPPAIFLMGPTASGKTDLAMRLCDALPCEIISVDSALIYSGMDIGSAKPSSQELSNYPHALVDIIDPAEAYSAADFREDALRLMAEITARGNIPLLVGGTMMYFNVLIKGMSDLPEADAAIRADIEARAQEQGWQAIHAELAAVDPESAERINPNDPQRLQRALEVYLLSGKTMTEHREIERQSKSANPFDDFPYAVTQIAITPEDRAVLHERIAKRFELMCDAGFEEEVKGLMARGDLDASMPSMRCVGYRQMWQYLDGEIDRETMLHKGVVATRQLAKRQLTWLRGWQSLNWIYTSDAVHDEGKDAVVAFLFAEAMLLLHPLHKNGRT